jgi:hypothetical protein
MGFYKRTIFPFVMDKLMATAEQRAGFSFETAREFFLDKGPRFGTFCTTGTAIRP